MPTLPKRSEDRGGENRIYLIRQPFPDTQKQTKTQQETIDQYHSRMQKQKHSIKC